MTRTFGQQLGTKLLKFMKRFYERFPIPENVCCNHSFNLDDNGQLIIQMVHKHNDGTIKFYPMTFEKNDYKKTEEQLFNEIENYFKEIDAQYTKPKLLLSNDDNQDIIKNILNHKFKKYSR